MSHSTDCTGATQASFAAALAFRYDLEERFPHLESGVVIADKNVAPRRDLPHDGIAIDGGSMAQEIADAAIDCVLLVAVNGAQYRP